MAQHVICRSLSSGREGGAAKAARGRQKLPGGGISYAMGGGAAAPPPQGYAGSGAGLLFIVHNFQLTHST